MTRPARAAESSGAADEAAEVLSFRDAAGLDPGDGDADSGDGDPGVFFFQAEDGIRAGRVTGVQTCALPISVCAGGRTTMKPRPSSHQPAPTWLGPLSFGSGPWPSADTIRAPSIRSRMR